MSHPVDIVYKSLTKILSPYMTPAKTVKGKCSSCGRPARDFSFLGYESKNSYRQDVMHCTACESFFVSAPEIMGVENPKKPNTGQKFGMWSGVGALINVNECSSVLLAPPGVVEKLPSEFFDMIKVVTATSGQHLEYLFKADLEYPIIYIRDFGRKTYELVRSIRISHSENAIYACQDVLMTPQNEVSFVIDLGKAKALHEEMKAFGKKETDAFIRTVSLLASGKITPLEASTEFKKHNVTSLVKLLPADPHQRINLLNLLRKV
ncbi:hypothetical protein [Dickeya sp. NCPPB 3274]|uniref:hypothetical protein n=1 Tax=Dickeya sp. NCPPB 3274 TaxID=568766 RepID=UPI0005B43E26|nr:hypothetical protein [Dickeya sp. NCPPB 3274]